MCGGGSRPAPATIVMPNTGAYDREFDLQRAAMEQQMQGQATLMQGQLNQALNSKRDLMEQLRDLKKEKASNVDRLDEQARRMSVLVGPPPPEKSASAPQVGAQRSEEQKPKRGKSALRIERPTAASTGQGAGLNIT